MSAVTYLLIGFALGGAIFLLIGWLLGSRRANDPSSSGVANELRQQLAQREAELNQSRTQITEVSTARATAEADRVAAEKMLAEQRALHAKALQEAKDLQARALVDLRDTFKALSADALRQTQPEFLRLANE